MNNFHFYFAASSSSFELTFVFSLHNIFYEKILVFIFELFFHQIIIVVGGHCYQHYFQYQYFFILVIDYTTFNLDWISSLFCIFFIIILSIFFFSGYMFYHFLCDNLGFVCLSVFQEWSSIIYNSCSCERKWK